MSDEDLFYMPGSIYNKPIQSDVAYNMLKEQNDEIRQLKEALRLIMSIAERPGVIRICEDMLKDGDEESEP